MGIARSDKPALQKQFSSEKTVLGSYFTGTSVEANTVVAVNLLSSQHPEDTISFFWQKMRYVFSPFHLIHASTDVTWIEVVCVR